MLFSRRARFAESPNIMLAPAEWTFNDPRKGKQKIACMCYGQECSTFLGTYRDVHESLREHGTRILLVTQLTVAVLTDERSLDASTTVRVFAEILLVEDFENSSLLFINHAREYKHFFIFYVFLSTQLHILMHKPIKIYR